MRKLFLVLIGSLACTLIVLGQKPYDLRTGDILFQTNKYSTSFVKAITDVTSSLEDLNFSHVGVALIENDSIYVLEAIPTGVSKTPLEKFFAQSKDVDGNPLVVVARLKPRFQKIIPQAIEYMKQQVGEGYDFIFAPDDNEFYCSEIIYRAFLRPNGKPIFKAKPMTFKDKTTNETNAYWEQHFRRLKVSIPEGVTGTNPGDMSRSKSLKIVHYYF